MRGATRLLAAVVMAASLSLAADGPVLRLIGPDAVWACGINFRAFINSPVGTRLLARMDSGGMAFYALASATGLDAKRDLRHAYFFSNAVALDAGKGVLVLDAQFDETRVDSFAKAQGATRSLVLDVPFYQKQAEAPAMAFFDGSLLAIGDPDMLRAAIARYRQPADSKAPLFVRLDALNANSDAWLFNGQPLQTWAARQPAAGDSNTTPLNPGMFQAMQSVSAALHFGEQVVVDGEADTNTEKDAASLVDIVRFLRGVLRMNRNQSAKNQVLAHLLTEVEPRAEGTRFLATAHLSDDDLGQILGLIGPKSEEPVDAPAPVQ